MCGIVGIYYLNDNHLDPILLKKMMDVIKHRGPNDDGYYIERSIALGHLRLSIIDLSPAGHQPMSNEDGSIWITYNGEVYNYVELMSELQTKGHIFKSKTDTEVIIHSYEEWGEECLNKFNGMFAFAIWEQRKNRLFCARDRFGIKPFYYYFDKKAFLFASEIKSLLESKLFQNNPNNYIIYDYLVYAYLDHTENTFFEGIKQLMPAHYLVLENGRLHRKRWWDIESTQEPCLKSQKSIFRDQEYAAKFYEIFSDSIKLHLRSDVPIGTCLSGGLDSSSIVCMANKLTFNHHNLDASERQKTFSSCFDDHKYDEREYINSVLEQTKAEANFIFLKGEDLFNIISKIIWHQDEPFGSTSIVAQWHVMKEASQKVKVLLDGQGADELLAGYHGYFGALYSDLLKKFHLVKLLKEIILYKIKHKTFQPHIFSNIARAFLPSTLVSLIRGKISHNVEWLDKDFQDKYKRNFTYPSKFKTNLDNQLYSILTTYGLPALLHYEDRNSMAFSIEARVPFLDHRLVEFMFSTPYDQKIRNGTTKIILRNAMNGIIPESVRMRQDKMGFVTPEDIWFKTTLKEEISEIINSKSFKERGYFNINSVKEEFKTHCTGKKNISNTIWRWINLELWFRIFGDSR